MNTSTIKRVKEEKLINSENLTLNKVKILFESSRNGIAKQETITLTGEGSVKVLLPV